MGEGGVEVEVEVGLWMQGARQPHNLVGVLKVQVQVHTLHLSCRFSVSQVGNIVVMIIEHYFIIIN